MRLAKFTARSTYSWQAAVICLLFLVSPSTVFGAVGGVIVDTVDCVGRIRSLSHIAKEQGKRIPPAITYSNSPTPPVGELLIVWISTPLDHSRPGVVFRGMTKSVRSVAGASLFNARSTSGAWILELSCADNKFLTALAEAMVEPIVVSAMRKLQNGKEAELTPRVIDRLRAPHGQITYRFSRSESTCDRGE